MTPDPSPLNRNCCHFFLKLNNNNQNAHGISFLIWLRSRHKKTKIHFATIKEESGRKILSSEEAFSLSAPMPTSGSPC